MTNINANTEAPRVKDWLVSKGHLPQSKAGRGPLSHEMRAIAQAALESGQKFSNWPLTVDNSPQKRAKAIRDGNKAQVTAKPVKATKAQQEAAKGGEDAVIEEIAPYRYHEDTHKAVELVPNAKSKYVERSLREVCQNDGVSLVQCTCGAPRIVAINGQGSVGVAVLSGKSAFHKPGKIWE